MKFFFFLPSEAVDLIEELMSADSEPSPVSYCLSVCRLCYFVRNVTVVSPCADMEYSFNLDNHEEVCDLFDVPIADWETAPLLYK